MSKPVAISFFSGAGGLDMGIHEAGFDVRLCCEIEKKYCDTLRANHPGWNVRQGDIMDYNRQKIYEEAGLDMDQEISLIFGGSPCQSFSTAGKRQAFEDARGKAMLQYVDIIEETQPKAFLLENVRGLLSVALKHRKIEERGKDFPELDKDEMRGSAFTYLYNKFKSYDVKYKIVNAANYGVPQKRERVFIIGIRRNLNKKFRFPGYTHSRNGKPGTEQWVTVRDVFNKLDIVKHNYVSYSPERLKYMKMIPQGGGNWRDLPANVVQEAMGGAYKSGGGKVGFFRRLKTDEPAPTLLTSPIQKSTNLGHPYEDRPLSIQEYLAIQGFPPDYKLAGSLTDQYTQIGNAVPVHLAEVMGREIYKTLY